MNLNRLEKKQNASLTFGILTRRLELSIVFSFSDTFRGEY